MRYMHARALHGVLAAPAAAPAAFPPLSQATAVDNQRFCPIRVNRIFGPMWLHVQPVSGGVDDGSVLHVLSEDSEAPLAECIAQRRASQAGAGYQQERATGRGDDSGS